MLDKIIERIDAVAGLWIEDATKVRRSEIPDVLYHYTDAAGLVGMLSSGKVWLTEYRFLNDRSEVAHTKNLVRRLVDESRSAKDDEHALQFYSDIMEYDRQERDATPFVFSLSEEHDDLSQWRGYAREGQGFTVGLTGLSLCESAEAAGMSLDFSKVDYDLDNQTTILRKALDDIEKQMRVEIASDSGIDPREIAGEAARTFDWLAHTRGTLNKHGSFAAEKEWRLVGYAYSGKRKGSVKVRSSGETIGPLFRNVPSAKGQQASFVSHWYRSWF